MADGVENIFGKEKVNKHWILIGGVMYKESVNTKQIIEEEKLKFDDKIKYRIFKILESIDKKLDMLVEIKNGLIDIENLVEVTKEYIKDK
jgi:hypothetical protein